MIRYVILIPISIGDMQLKNSLGKYLIFCFVANNFKITGKFALNVRFLEDSVKFGMTRAFFYNVCLD